MSIVFCFLILAAVALVVSVVVTVVMYRVSIIQPTVLIGIWAAFIVAGVILYITSSSAGVTLTSAKLADKYEIDTTTYNAVHYSNGAAYAFFTDDGISFSLTSDELLEPVSEEPTLVETYYCTYLNGFSWCYTGEEEAVRYILR